jgi:hypothetical protein
MAIPLAQQRKVLQRSGNICAFPGCRLLLTTEGTDEDPVVVLGEIAHIVAESPNGPRGKSPLTTKQRNLYANLILLCNQHHQLIDSDGALAMYTVERLTAMKEDHESWVERALRGRRNAAPVLPPMRQDTVYSNMLPVRQMPRFVYGAPCAIERENDVVPEGAPESVMTPRIVRGGWLWAFQDLRDEHGPFAHAVTAKEAEEYLAEDWWSEPDRLAWYIALLNRSLNKMTGRLGLRLDRAHRRYYFEPDEPGLPKQVTYRPLNATRATRSVVWQPMARKTGEPRNYWLHRAVNLRFIQASSAEWHLGIRPELRVTSNGFDSIDSQYVGRRVTKSKSRWFNYDLLGEVQFWRDFLSHSSSMITLPFGGEPQRLLISNSMAKTKIQWPGIPDEYAMPFRNVEYLDDLSTWAEAEELDEEFTDDQEEAQAEDWVSELDEEELKT